MHWAVPADMTAPRYKGVLGDIGLTVFGDIGLTVLGDIGLTVLGDIGLTVFQTTLAHNSLKFSALFSLQHCCHLPATFSFLIIY